MFRSAPQSPEIGKQLVIWLNRPCPYFCCDFSHCDCTVKCSDIKAGNMLGNGLAMFIGPALIRGNNTKNSTDHSSFLSNFVGNIFIPCPPPLLLDKRG